jgi:hypothetical protein
MAPSPDATKAVTNWLAAEGVTVQALPGHGDWLGFNTTVAQASRLFAAFFSTYHDVRSGTQHVRTTAYSIPAHLKEHIELVHPMTRYICRSLAVTLVANTLTEASRPCAVRAHPSLHRGLPCGAGHPARAPPLNAATSLRPLVYRKSMVSPPSRPQLLETRSL